MAHIIAPLAIWLIKRTESPAIDATGKEVLNFQISISIYLLISAILWVILVGFLFSGIVAIFWVICPIIAAIRTSNGKTYRYPMTIRFLK